MFVYVCFDRLFNRFAQSYGLMCAFQINWPNQVSGPWLGNFKLFTFFPRRRSSRDVRNKKLS